MFFEIFRGASHGLTGNEDLVTHAFKCMSQFFFAVAVSSGGVKETHTSIVSSAQDLDCRVHVHSLYRECAKCILWNSDACGS